MPAFSFKPVILVVEDEPLVRMYLADLLDEEGFRVVEAANAEEALALFQARRDVLAVITDVEMPGHVDGYELARTIRERSPSTGVIVSSGRAWPGSDDLPEGAVFLPKPVSPAELVALVRRMTEQVAPAGGAVHAPAQVTIEMVEGFDSVPLLPPNAAGAERIVVEIPHPAEELDR